MFGTSGSRVGRGRIPSSRDAAVFNPGAYSMESALRLAIASVATRPSLSTSSSGAIDVKIDAGGLVGLAYYVQLSEAFAARKIATTAKYTVPPGAVAVVIGGFCNDQQKSNLSFYGHRLHNATSGVVAGAFAAARLMGGATGGFYIDQGFVNSSNADSAVPYPFNAGVAGDVLQCEAWSAGDAHTRLQMGAYIVAILDAGSFAQRPIIAP